MGKERIQTDGEMVRDEIDDVEEILNDLKDEEIVRKEIQREIHITQAK